MSSLKGIDPLTDRVWWETVSASPRATFFHTPAWCRAVCRTYPELVDRSLAFELEGGARAVFPLIEKPGKIPFSTIRMSTFAGCYGGIVSDGTVTCRESREIYRRAIGGPLCRLQITESPFSVEPVEHDWMVSTSDYSQVVGLTEGYEVVRERYAYSCRKQIKKGERAGLRARQTRSVEDLDAYYEIYRSNLQHWGKTGRGYPVELFKELLSPESECGEQTALWIVEAPDGSVIGGDIVFYWARHAVEWHSVFRRELFRSGVRNYLVDRIIRDAIDRGFEVYDFNPSGGHHGVERFKETFGAERLPLRRLAARRFRGFRR